MSARAPSGSPVRWLRRVLLGLLLAMIAGLVGLYLLGRPRPIEEALESGTVEEGPGSERDVIAWSQGFEFEQKVGERTAFSLRGDRFATDREGVTRLEGVDLELAREQETYRVRSRRATWNPEKREARLAGQVRLEGGRGFWLESARLDLIGEGRTLVSRELVRFGSRRGVEGRANDLRFDVDQDQLLLRGRVRAASPATAEREAFSVESDQVVYNRAEGFLRAQGRVEVVSGADRVRAHEVKVELEPSGERPRRILAHGQVIGGLDPDLEEAPADSAAKITAATREAAAAGAEVDGGAMTEARDEELTAEEEEAESAGRIRFRADLARVELGATDGGIRTIELEGEETDPARVLFRVDETTSRILRAPRISAQVAKGELSGAKAEGGVQIRERVVGAAGAAVQRTASAESAEAGFGESGELARLELLGSVELAEPSFEARGERAVLDVASGSSRLEGGDRRAWARSARGELLAPEILHSREGGEIEARGGVHSTLFSGEGSAVRLGPGGGDDEKEPIRVESKTARWREEGRGWEFRGDVRAAQGDRLLFAEHLEGSEATGDMSAEGGVRTLWSEPGEEAGKKVSTAVSAERLRYLAEPGRAEYEGRVEVRQLDRELGAAKLVVELDVARRARRMLATGGVTIVDRKSGRKVEGETADHDLVARTILVEGAPVVLSEGDGSKLRGPRLLYDVATGSARMIGSGESQ